MIIRKNEYYRSRKFIFAINTQNDFWMILVSALMGIGLSFIVGWPLLIMGLYCYLIGIFIHQDRNLYLVYHWEVFSGFTMGFMITLICVYINTFEVFNWSAANLWGFSWSPYLTLVTLLT